MKTARRFGWGLVSLFLVLDPNGPAATEDPDDGRAQAERVLRAALGDPYDTARRAAFAATLPRYDDRYVVEGDLLLTDQQLRDYLVNAASGGAPLLSNELIVNTSAGRDDIWPRDNRKLSYSIDRASFGPGQAAIVQENLAKAAKAWIDACPSCGLSFRLNDAVQRPRRKPMHFVVRKVSSGGLLATSFFPSDEAANMVLVIDQSYFTTRYDPVGILRHELGHILGYRHEHIEGIPGCYREGGTWRRLTAYDSRSVMHYLCGGKRDLKFQLTPSDIRAHQAKYGD